MRPIGFYVHHQGRGHAARVRQIVAHLKRPAVIFCSRPDYFDPDCPAEVIALPLDYGAPNAYPQHRSPPANTLHYAPLDVEGLRQRMSIIATWVARCRPALMVVDLSVELVTFCRLLGVPTVAVRLQGDRADAAHLSAFGHARAILCPFAERMEAHPLPPALRAKCYYTGAYARFPGARDGAPRAVGARDPTQILVLIGGGGTSVTLEHLAVLAEAVPGRTVHVLGDLAAAKPVPPNLHVRGVRADVGAWLARAALVVGNAGNSVCYEVGAFRKPFVCLPEPRAFGEQESNARALERLGLAVKIDAWPDAANWPAVLAKAAALDTRGWDELFFDPQLSATAAFLESLAAECD